MSSLRTDIRITLRNALPPRLRLAYDYHVARLMGRVEPELRRLDRITPGGRIAIDVGANQGFYSYVLSRRFRRVLAFEPNAAIGADLACCAAGNIEIHQVALSTEDGWGELFVPQVAGVEQHGWASFDPYNLPDATAVAAFEVPVRSLDGYDLHGVDFIKIDVEGHEADVLAGARETLRRDRPALLAEVRRANFERVACLLSEFGYAPYRLRGDALVPWNAAQRWDGENFVFRAADR